jgi:hypothetical protein
MRLSQTKQLEISEKIKKDLYDKPIKTIDKEQEDLVYENYLLWVAPYIDIANKLPNDMVSRDKQIYMSVTKNVEWNYYHTADLITTVKGSGWNAKSQAIPLQQEIEKRVLDLLTKEKALYSEKNELMDYVNESMDKLGTTVKLRKAWPQALQKYIPPEPVRATRKSKEEQEELFTAPTDAIKQRMTENLLEG